MPDKTLAHYGVKGMKWGIRRKKPRPRVDTVEARNGKVRKVTLSEKSSRMSPHTDATRVAVLRQRAKERSTDTLSNDELKSVVNRMNLEQQYSNLSQQRKSAGRKFLEGLFKEQAQQQTRQLVSEISKAARS